MSAKSSFVAIRRRGILYGLFSGLSFCTAVFALCRPLHSRRTFFAASFATSGSLLAPPGLPASASNSVSNSTQSTPLFRTLGYGQEEYTNSITASRDTNISPREAYDVIRERIPKARPTVLKSERVLDVGAGAGVSTAVLYNELGYRNIDAIDWSADAWEDNVISIPESVRFYAMADDVFFQRLQRLAKDQLPSDPKASDMITQYSVICYNFAVNFRKAERVAQQHLTEDGILLAPVNDKADYWYKQSYYILNKQGKILWKSAPEVGAWSVQFQPDVTSDTCTGIWCRGFNSFR